MKKIIPKRIRPLLVETYIRFTGLTYRIYRLIYMFIWRGSKYTCPFCGHSFHKFLPIGFKFKVLKEKKIVGGGYRKNAICPFCSSSDRERLVYIFLKSNNLLKPRMRIFHVAPERNLQKKISEAGMEYFSAGLSNSLANIRMDIQNIKFPSNYFDAIICIHVLEHIVHDEKAMRELYRVLKPEGWAILQVPYSPIMENTFENPLITGPKEREKVFGQADHVRIYGRDYQKRLQSVGFSVKQEKADVNSIKNFALNPDEIIFFCHK